MSAEIQNLKPRDVAEACAERMGDPAIRTRLDELLDGVSIPEVILGGPIMPFAPYLATPNKAVRFVMEQIEGSGLTPVIFPYKQDKFVSLNPEKAACTSPMFDFLRITRNGVKRIREGLKVVEVEKRREGDAIGDLKTIFEGSDTESLSLGEFYDLLCKKLIPELPNFEFSEMLSKLATLSAARYGRLSERYYLFVMAINQVFGPGVNIGGNEDPIFYMSTVKPALLNAARILGVEPISLDVGEIPTGKEARIIPVDLSGIVELESELGLKRSKE